MLLPTEGWQALLPAGQDNNPKLLLPVEGMTFIEISSSLPRQRGFEQFGKSAGGGIHRPIVLVFYLAEHGVGFHLDPSGSFLN